jgi:chemotaxis protein MotB
MKKYAVLAALAASVIMTFSACTVMRDTYRKKADEADTLSKRYAALEKEHEGLKAELAATKQQKDKLAAELAYATTQWDKTLQDRDAARRKVSELEKENMRLAKAKEEQVKKVSSTYDDLLEKMKTEIERGQITISELKGKLSVNMVDSILFDSGKAEVKKGGEEILDKVVSILKDVEDKAIRIEGHTDNVLISPSLAKRYPTNWELSAARAINVTRFLQRQGIPTDRLSAVAYGEWKPVGDNAAPEGRAKNRRIEINLVDRDQP